MATYSMTIELDYLSTTHLSRPSSISISSTNIYLMIPALWIVPSQKYSQWQLEAIFLLPCIVYAQATAA